MNNQEQSTQTIQERFKRGVADAGRFFSYIADFIGFTPEDAAAIKDTRFIIEKYIPTIVGKFYSQLLRFPATRQPFLRKDGTIDQDYLELRMQHQASFWRRAASGDYDEDFARFVDYVGRAHTSHGADPNIYIPERYVIGMVAFVQRGIAEAMMAELREVDPDLERRATKAWNALMMVILEMLARSYNTGNEREAEPFAAGAAINDEQVFQLAVDTYERSLGIARSIEHNEVLVANADEIPEGERKIVEVDGLSIGVFHHKGAWYALHNSCLHRGGPVCTGSLEGDTLTCPWHGYQYDVTSGRLLLDPSARLDKYKVDVRDGKVYLTIPTLVGDNPAVVLNAPGEATPSVAEAGRAQPVLKENEFRLSDLKPGQAKRISLNGRPVAVYNVAGAYYATQEKCTHAGGPLSEGRLDGTTIICPWHDSCFDVTDGKVLCKPARKPLETYRIVIESDVGRVE